MRLGNIIATKIKELGLTQQELADKLFVSVKTISKWETNRGNPEINILPKIAEVLNINISDLFDEKVNYEEPTSEKRKYDIYNACFEFGFAFLGLIFFAVTFIIVEGNLPIGDSFFGDVFDTRFKYSLSGYRILFNMSGTNFLGSLLIFSIWISFFTILAHIAFGIIEIMVAREDIIQIKNKVSFIVSIVGLSSIGFAFIIYLLSTTIGIGIVLTLLLFIFILGYNIKYKKDNELNR